MEKIVYYFKKIIYPACVFFTLIVFTISALFYTSQGEITLTISPANLAQIFCFSVIASCSFLPFSKLKNKWLAALIQLIILILDFAIVFCLIGGHCDSSSQAFILIAVISAIYLVIALPILIVRAILNKNKVENKEYKRQFR